MLSQPIWSGVDTSSNYNDHVNKKINGWIMIRHKNTEIEWTPVSELSFTTIQPTERWIFLNLSWGINYMQQNLRYFKCRVGQFWHMNTVLKPPQSVWWTCPSASKVSLHCLVIPPPVLFQPSLSCPKKGLFSFLT